MLICRGFLVGLLPIVCQGLFGAARFRNHRVVNTAFGLATSPALHKMRQLNEREAERRQRKRVAAQTRHLIFSCLVPPILMAAFLTGCASVSVKKVPTPSQYVVWTDQMQADADEGAAGVGRTYRKRGRTVDLGAKNQALLGHAEPPRGPPNVLLHVRSDVAYADREIERAELAGRRTPVSREEGVPKTGLVQ